MRRGVTSYTKNIHVRYVTRILQKCITYFGGSDTGAATPLHAVMLDFGSRQQPPFLSRHYCPLRISSNLAYSAYFTLYVLWSRIKIMKNWDGIKPPLKHIKGSVVSLNPARIRAFKTAALSNFP